MGTVFEGVVVAGGLPTVPPTLVVAEIGGDLGVVYHEDWQFHDEMASVAGQLSTPDAALHVRYDDHVGFRWSALYRRGALAQEFGERDELWVLAGAHGPILDGPRLTIDQLDDAEEYETAQNAIQLGLAALGRPQAWDELFDLITG